MTKTLGKSCPTIDFGEKLRDLSTAGTKYIDVALLCDEAIPLHAEIAVARHARPHAGLRLRHSFVDRAQLRSTGVELLNALRS
jgi:hypothetical protein